MSEGFETSFHTVRALPRELRGLAFREMKEAILGKEYELSVVYCGRRLSRKLNLTHRGKDKAANVLSFPLSKSSGEIFLDLVESRSQAPSFDTSYRNFVGKLFIHGLLHLKGMEHGRTMEKAEIEFANKFDLTDQK